MVSSQTIDSFFDVDLATPIVLSRTRASHMNYFLTVGTGALSLAILSHYFLPFALILASQTSMRFRDALPALGGLLVSATPASGLLTEAHELSAREVDGVSGARGGGAALPSVISADNAGLADDRDVVSSPLAASQKDSIRGRRLGEYIVEDCMYLVGCISTTV